MNDLVLPTLGKLTLYEDTRSYFTGRHFCDKKLFAWAMPGNKVEAMPSGKVVFQEILKALDPEKVEKFVWVADWQMGFDVELDDRGVPADRSKAPHWAQLIKVFERLIQKGRQVRVLLWCSPADNLGTFDGLVTKTINAINKPEYPGKVIVLQQWSTSAQIDSFNYAHHQKFVVIDGKIGFLGGIDLSYGRYETPEYDVVLDPSIRVINEMYNTCATKLRKMSPEEDTLVADYGFTPAYGGTLLEEGCQARMPWQDVQLKFSGPAAVDLHRNFVRRWNATLRDREAKTRAESLLTSVFFNPGRISKPNKETAANPAELDAAWFDYHGATGMLKAAQTDKTQGQAVVQIVRSVSKKELALECTKDGAFKAPDDIGLYVDPFHRQAMIDSIKKYQNQHQSNILDAMLNCIASADNYIYIENQFFISDFGTVGKLKYRLTRAGLVPYYPVDSSKMGNEEDGIKNTLLTAVGEKIGYHINARTNFHVYLVFPVHPEGSIADDAMWKQQWQALASIKWGSKSLINRIKKSLKAVGRSEDDWTQYLTVLNMRNYGVAVQYARDPKTFREDYTREIGRYVITEQIYVHTKMLIVDDAVAIIGTANINDRSLTGNGDTEVSAVVMDDEDKQYLDLGEPRFKAVTRKFARELRRSLWTKHFGFALNEKAYFNTTERARRHGVTPHSLPDGAHPPREKTTEGKLSDALKSLSINGVSWQQILDKPCDPKTVQAIQALAASNAKAYEDVFTHTPRNGMKDFKELLEHYTLPYPVQLKAAVAVDEYVADSKRQREAQYLPFYDADAASRHPQYPPGTGAKERARIDREYAETITAAQGKAAKNSYGVVPPALQPRFMTTALQPFQQQGLQVPVSEVHNRYLVYRGNQVHNIGPAIDYLKKNVVGFFVAMPLDWGDAVQPGNAAGKSRVIVDISKADPEATTTSQQG
jgi:phospholipase D1/2